MYIYIYICYTKCIYIYIYTYMHIYIYIYICTWPRDGCSRLEETKGVLGKGTVQKVGVRFASIWFQPCCFQPAHAQGAGWQPVMLECLLDSWQWVVAPKRASENGWYEKLTESWRKADGSWRKLTKADESWRKLTKADAFGEFRGSWHEKLTLLNLGYHFSLPILAYPFQGHWSDAYSWTLVWEDTTGISTVRLAIGKSQAAVSSLHHSRSTVGFRKFMTQLFLQTLGLGIIACIHFLKELLDWHWL